MRWLFVLTAACGRLGFDPLGTPGAGGDNADGNTAASLSPCAISATAPDPLHVQGTVLRVNFAGGMSGEAGVIVAVLDETGDIIAQTTSDPSGTYSISVSTGGRPLVPRASLAKSGLVTTVVAPDGAIDRDVVDPNTYVAQAGALTSIYFVGGVTQNMSKGTIGVEVRDCAGAVIEGATVTMSPAPEKIVYTNNLGIPSTGQMATTGPFGLAIGLNAEPTTLTVSAAKQGLSFTAHVADVRAGSFLTDALMRPNP